MLTKIALAAALLIGAGSVAFADDDGFDVDINRPAVTTVAPRNADLNAFAQVMPRLDRRAATSTPATGEKNWIDRASQSTY